MRYFVLIFSLLGMVGCYSVEHREVLCEDQVLPRICQSLENNEDVDISVEDCVELSTEAGVCNRIARESLRLDECAAETASLEGANTLSQSELPESCDGIVLSVERVVEGDFSELADGGA